MKIKMKPSFLHAGFAAISLFTCASLQAADQTLFTARSGSKMRVEGTSTVHDWTLESTLIAGSLEVGSNFPVEPGQAVTPGKVTAKGEASLTVRSLKSIEKDGRPYSDTMDSKAWEMLQQPTFPKIVFRLDELTLKDAAKDKTSPYVFEVKGDLAVAGVTNKITFPLNVTPLGDVKGDKRLKLTASVPLKMTDYKVEPASIVFAKTGNDVTIKFEWNLGHKEAAAAAK
jgi:polyisoprenoid-binding protein YceI